MDNATFQRIKDLVLKHQEIGVIVGQNPSLDEMAAGLGMFLSLKLMGKQVAIASPSAPTVSLSSLVGIDKVQNSLGGGIGGDLTVAFPYKEGEIEKVSYTLENGFLNIQVKAGEKGLSFSQQDVQFKRAGKMPSLLFFIGVAHINDVSSIYSQGTPADIVNMDNKADNEKYGNVVVVDTKWSSVSEQVADFVTLLEPQIELDADTAQNLLDGIDFATSDFTSPKTSYLAFEVAGILMKKGATRQRAKQVSSASSAQGVNPATSGFFPSIPQQPVQQTQSVAQPQPMQPAWQPQPIAQPIQPAQQQPVQQPVQQPQQIAQPVQETQQNSGKQTPPPDWLTPKVYKGSTIL